MPDSLSVCLSVALATVIVLATTVSGLLTSNEKKEILRAHNYFRRNVQPLATNMIKLEWDDELARQAQYSSAVCEFMRNEHRHDQSNHYDYVGENIGATANYSYNLTLIVQGWWEANQYYDYYTAYCGYDDDDDNNGKRKKRMDDREEFDECQSYTQLVWAQTSKIGCGAFRCSELRMYDEGDYGAMLVVCNYGPGGAYQGIQPYITGSSPCSNCPSSRSKCSDKLCSGALSTTAYMWLLIAMAILGTAFQQMS